MIELDQRYSLGQNLDSDFAEFRSCLPKPLLVELSRVEAEPTPEGKLEGLCLSLIPLTFQYLGLILSGEYLASISDPDYDVADSLWNMVRKPGPGKWVDFIRRATGYFSDTQPHVLSRQALENLELVLLSDKHPWVRTFDENPMGKRLHYVDALVNLRNRYAHSPRRTRKNAAEVFSDYFSLYRTVLLHLRYAFDSVPLIESSDGRYYINIGNRATPTIPLLPAECKASMLLWNPSTGAYIQLFPLLLPLNEKGEGEAALLEEVKGKYFLYPYGDEQICMVGEEFISLRKLIEARTPKTSPLTKDDLSASLLAERIDRQTRRTLTDFQDALKYIPEIYTQRPEIEQQLDEWVETAGETPGCILLGDPGTGKTSLVAGWCKHRQEKAHDHILLLEASKLKGAGISRIIEEKLKFSAGLTLSGCFGIVKRQIEKNGQVDPDDPNVIAGQFIIVIDAVNEYIDVENHRSQLWNQIDRLMDTLWAFRPHFKCLVTTRSDLWKVDFPSREALSDRLTPSMYYGNVTNLSRDFPCLMVGLLSDDEAEDIYEKARSKRPGMSPLTPYSELPEQTRKTIRNPFCMRLTLQTFDDESVPSLSARTLHRRWAREKAMEGKTKTAVLFQLLERIGELRKTELTLDEFLSEKGSTAKLEQIVLDLKPDSPYKKLLADGIIEERTTGEGESSEVRISFAQEKTIDVMYSEFQRRYLRRKLRNVAILFFVFVLMVAALHAYIGWNVPLIEERVSELLSAVGDNVDLTQNEKGTLTTLVSAINAEYWRRTLNCIDIVLAFCFFIWAFFGVFADQCGFYINRWMGGDLGTRFVKEKLSEHLRKCWRYVLLLLGIFGICLALLLLRTALHEVSPEPAIIRVVEAVLLSMGSVFLIELALKLFVIQKYATRPEAAFIWFGSRAMKQSLLTILPILPVMFILLFLLQHVAGLFDFSKDSQLLSLYRQLIESPVYAKLTAHAPQMANLIKERVLYSPEQSTVLTTLMSSYFTLLRQNIPYTLVIFLPIYYLLLWLLAGPLELSVRRKLAQK